MEECILCYRNQQIVTVQFVRIREPGESGRIYASHEDIAKMCKS